MKLDFSLSWLNKLFKKFLKRTLLEKILIIIIIVPLSFLTPKRKDLNKKKNFF